MKRTIFCILICINFIKICTSGHNHTPKHDVQWLRMINLGKKFDIEVEKVKKGQEYQFSGIFKAQSRLVSSITCLSCQKSYRSLCQYNKEVIVPNIIDKLAKGELPKIDNERGHYV
jgi:hypothetical protein